MVNTPIRQIDPDFYIPEELIGFEYAEDDTPDPDFEEGIGEGVEEDVLDPPSNIKIIKQTIRENAAGNEVVDVIIEIEDKKKGLTYDVKTAVETVDPDDYSEFQNEEV